MPFSHCALTVSHIPSATSFYLAALQPLGYQYIGQQGNSIGFGQKDKDADFFLCQEPRGARVTPTHIAFAVGGRLAVRDCYAAALDAGGVPSGAPSYRNSDCSCFNAAVSDLDGNTIEFIYRENNEQVCKDNDVTLSETGSRISAWHKDVTSTADHDDVSIDTKLSRSGYRANTAADLASTTSRSNKHTATEAMTPSSGQANGSNKTVVGTLLGAAAGAALTYAMCKSEQDNARNEVAFGMSEPTRASERAFRRGSRNGSQVSSTTARGASSKSRQHYNAVESANNHFPAVKAIEPVTYQNDKSEAQARTSQYVQHRNRPNVPTRSHTYDDYLPTSKQSVPSRAHTLPHNDSRYYSDAARVSPSQNRDVQLGSRKSSSSRNNSTNNKNSLGVDRHDSAVSLGSHKTQRSELHLNDSTRSSPPSEGLRLFAGNKQTRSNRDRVGSQSSTTRPTPSSAYYKSAVDATPPPLMASRSATRRDNAHTTTNIRGPLQTPKYRPREEGIASSRGTSYVSARDMPLPPSITGDAYLAEPTDGDDDGLSDVCTIVPDDSISCVDYSKPTRRSTAGDERGSGSSSSNSIRRAKGREDDRRSAAMTTVKPIRGSTRSKASAATMPMPNRMRSDVGYGRQNRQGRQTVATYA